MFPGLICSAAPSSVPPPGAPPLPNPCDKGKLAFGIYQADLLGRISAVVEPGSPAPGGSTFDYVSGPVQQQFRRRGLRRSRLRRGMHRLSRSARCRIFCGESVYLKDGRTGKITSIAHQGQRSPVPGKKYQVAFGPVLNDLGDLAFLADLSTGSGEYAVFLYSHGNTITIAKPGDSMPGGGVLKQAGGFPHNAYLNNNQEVAFIGTLSDGGQGLYRGRTEPSGWSPGMVPR